MKLLKDQLSDVVGKKEEDGVKIKEFDVSVSVAFLCLNIIFGK